MNKRFDPQSNIILSDIIDNIKTTLKCPKFLEYSGRIDIETWENCRLRMNRHKTIAEKGFAFCNITYYEYLGVKWEIIINMENCDRAGLTDKGIAAVIYHELGHLLNEPELMQVPTLQHCMMYGTAYSRDLEEEIRTNNCIQMELFADAYANRYGYGADLITSFHKQNHCFDQQINFFDIRVEKINEKEFFEGVVMKPSMMF